ncbi:transcriptional regulator, ArsR family [Agreia bicolorata]|uniref:Transcriptional regulator, ArsR family n=1 Tax=Agreia bicolorata TaxID=110935 RepID=A0A1T4Y6G6_9MICO|nr:helix-turn-helix domain-containing protein [Agreia bicolorata]SKA97397.1 transcriptional regulator, ArsR family [Agreia bicolorata]
MTPTDPSRSTLTSAASMRVLAHPTRLRLLGLLRERGPQTAAQLGDVVDEAPGTVSYHLAKLASIDLIEPAEPQTHDRRERWWQATAALTSWDAAELLDDPDKSAASSALQKSVGQVYAAGFANYVDSLPSLPREWVAAGTSSDRILRLTVDELTALTAELDALVARYSEVSEAHDPSDDSGAAPVSVVYQTYRRP